MCHAWAWTRKSIFPSGDRQMRTVLKVPFKITVSSFPCPTFRPCITSNCVYFLVPAVVRPRSTESATYTHTLTLTKSIDSGHAVFWTIGAYAIGTNNPVITNFRPEVF